ncbi:putative ethylene-responsive transcription factor-like [Capsicum annuum]|nr:putative ethylene-responsive transcription factor-like [Capsicum annuum]KAF3646221.1 putative ethylene-responsive transcription factor-like [Capsicum annuum]
MKLEKGWITTVKLSTCSSHGSRSTNACIRVIPRERLSFVKQHGLGLSPACLAALSSVSNAPAEDTKLTFTGIVRLIPDLSTRCKILWEKQQEMTLADMCIEPGKPWEYCPREVFRKVVKILKDEFDLVHAETGKGQYEVVLGYTEASTAIISLIYEREVIKSVARQHGMMATFVPKYAEDEDGSGSHVHISLSRNGENVFMASGDSKYGMSKIGESFMAGVFNHLPAILAFTATHPLSYERMLPKTRNAAYVCWGKENTEARLRTASPPGIADGLVNHFEIKAFDACANPYLSLAAIILSGVDGLRKDLSLPKPVEEDTLFSEVMSENLLIAIKGIRKMEVKNYCEPERDYSQPEMDAFKDPLEDFIFKF